MASRNSFLGHFTRTTFYFVLALAMVMTESSGRRRRLLTVWCQDKFCPSFRHHSICFFDRDTEESVDACYLLCYRKRDVKLERAVAYSQ